MCENFGFKQLVSKKRSLRLFGIPNRRNSQFQTVDQSLLFENGPLPQKKLVSKYASAPLAIFNFKPFTSTNLF